MAVIPVIVAGGAPELPIGTVMGVGGSMALMSATLNETLSATRTSMAPEAGTGPPGVLAPAGRLFGNCPDRKILPGSVVSVSLAKKLECPG